MVEHDITIAPEEIEGVDITQEDIKELEGNVNSCVDFLQAFEELLEEYVDDINSSQVYEELGIQLDMDVDIDCSISNEE
jgi:hypothetical protein